MIITILLAILIIGLLIFSHELGHFVAARKLGVAVEEFGFGFPPRIIGLRRLDTTDIKKISSNETLEMKLIDIKDDQNNRKIIKETLYDKIQETNRVVTKKKWQVIYGPKKIEDNNKNTIYSLNWIPIGGFVKIKGEQGDKKEQKDSFAHRKIWQRTIILSGGVFMNIILAFLLISLGFMIGLPTSLNDTLPGPARVKNQAIQIAEVQPDSPAATAGLKMGDFIVSVDGQKFSSVSEFQAHTKPKLNKEVTLVVKRANEEMTITLMPANLNNDGQGVIGTWLVETGQVSYPWYYSIWMGAKTTVLITGQIILAFFSLLKNLIISQQIPSDIAGPVGIAALTGQMAKMGFIYILQFTALFSINLAILNFLPFPALDGGRVMFLIIEKIRGRPLNQRIENLVNNVGFLMLMVLVALVTFRDIWRLTAHGLKGLFGIF